jgi:hypothetical protein
MNEIDELLQQKLEELEHGKPLDEVLAHIPAEMEGLASLVMLASSMRAMPHPKPVRPALQPLPARGNGRAALPRQRSSWPRLGLATGLAGAAAAIMLAMVSLAAFGLWLAGPRSARTAILLDLNGQVELANSSDEWHLAEVGERIGEGTRIRTGDASSATLLFYEGSRATLSADTDLSISRLGGSWNKVLKVGLNQYTGQTSHSVVPLHSPDGRYQVLTPSGLASVRGTVFKVAVNPGGQSHFAVERGRVLVSQSDVQVMLVAGQATASQPDDLPQDPAYQFSLSGVVTSIEGDVWVVNDVPFLVTIETTQTGDSQFGSFVLVEGRIFEDGSRIADRITVVADQEEASTFTGILESMDGLVWQVSGTKILVNAQTELEAGLATGDPIKVKFVVLADERWLAVEIEKLDEDPEETPPPSEETPVPTVITSTLPVSGTISATPVVTSTLVTTCTGAYPHPTGQKLAQRYGVTYEEIMGWFCQSFGFGEIDLAYGFSLQSGLPVEDIFALRSAGLGWGQIKAQLRNVTPTPLPTITATLTATLTTTVTVEPSETPLSPTETPVPPEATTCTGADPHPTGQTLAARYGVSYEEIMGWFCQGFGFGEIDQAYSLSLQVGVPVSEIFAMRSSGMGWGNIEQYYNPKLPKPTRPPKPKKP